MKGSEMTYRGAQVGPEATPDDIRTLRDYGVNIVRWQIHPQPVDHVSAWRKEVIAGIGRMITCANAVPEVAFVADLHKVMIRTGLSLSGRKSSTASPGPGARLLTT
jgi:sugar phosphate isomerase/epimerase